MIEALKKGKLSEIKDVEHKEDLLVSTVFPRVLKSFLTHYSLEENRMLWERYEDTKEKLNNPNFNYGEYAAIRSKAGLNNFKVSVKEWVEKTNAIGLRATAGRYGGTYAHKDIAFEFGMWISPEFKIYLIKEFQRLKEQERELLGWDIRRNLAKINYRIHTDAIKENLIPEEITKEQANCIYASEADILNVALFGMIAKEWRDSNTSKNGNIKRLRKRFSTGMPFQSGKPQCPIHQ